MSSTVPDTSDQQIRIVVFEVCDCDISDFAISPHVKISVSYRSLSNPQAVAISYAWGDFSRKRVSVGHYADDAHHTAHLILGAEWSRQGFVDRLAELSRDRGGCWLDQLCMPQKDEEIHEALAKIPDIYKTLPVVVMLPGPVCKCLSDAFEKYDIAFRAKVEVEARAGSKTRALKNLFRSKARMDQAEQLEEAQSNFKDANLELAAAQMGYYCLNSMAFCSWPDRIWTYQEMRYATVITICLADQEGTECVLCEDDEESTEQLTGYNLLHYSHLREERLTHSEAMQEMRMKHNAFWTNLIDLCSRYEYKHSNLHKLHSAEEAGYKEVLARLMLGETAVLGARVDPTAFFTRKEFNNADSVYSQYQALVAADWQHLQNCVRLAKQKLSATQPKDLVCSIWVDQPFYKIPRTFKSCTAYELLDDALKQCTSRNKYLAKDNERPEFVPTLWPAGLFGAAEASAWWNIDYYHPIQPPNDCRDIYGPFLWQSNKIYYGDHAEKAVPLKLGKRTTQSEQVQYEDIAKDLPNEIILEKLNAMLMYVEPRQETSQDDETFTPYLSTTGDPASELYDFVCSMLYLDATVCRNKRIELMYAWRNLEEPYIELGEETKILTFGLVNGERLKQAKRVGRAVVTVAIEEKDRPLYEIVQVDDHSKQFQVFGVWLPLRDECKCVGLEAFISGKPKGEYDAVLV